MITVAVQKGNSVYVYGENNQLMFMKLGELYGFTSTTVSVKIGIAVYTYNDRGMQISTKTIG